MKEVYDVNDLMELLHCSKVIALKVKREIKAVSDITQNVRTVHRVDYENYIESKRLRSAETKDKEQPRKVTGKLVYYK